MKRFLYIMPAILILMLYALLTALAGGISGFQSIAVVNMGLPVVAGVLLRKGKWWGCLFGIAMGGIMLCSGMTAEPQMMLAFVTGLILAAYFSAMGLVCAADSKKK